MSGTRIFHYFATSSLYETDLAPEDVRDIENVTPTGRDFSLE